MGLGERRGYVNFRIHVDDSELMNSLKDIQSEGQDEPAYAYQPYDAKAKKNPRTSCWIRD